MSFPVHSSISKMVKLDFISVVGSQRELEGGSGSLRALFHALGIHSKRKHIV